MVRGHRKDRRPRAGRRARRPHQDHARTGEKVYYHWLENIEPWCISRQLWWGHQIPVWYGLDLGAMDVATTTTTARSTRSRCCGLLIDGRLVNGDEVIIAPRDFDGVQRRVRSTTTADTADADQPCPRRRGRRQARRRSRCWPQAWRDYAVEPGPDQSGLPGLARPRRARHLVLLRPLAHRHAGLARADRRS